MVISEFEQVVASLPRVSVLKCAGVNGNVIGMVFVLRGLQELTNSPIMMYDPLPPLDSTCGYTRPERSYTTCVLSNLKWLIYSHIHVSQDPSNSE